MSLGKLLYEANGKQTALRILDANGSLESSGNDNGKFRPRSKMHKLLDC